MSYVGLLVSPPGGDGQLVEVVSPQCQCQCQGGTAW